MSRDDLRLHYRQARAARPKQWRLAQSQRIAERVLAAQLVFAPARVAGYVAQGSEVDPSYLLDSLLARGIEVYLPACLRTTEMEFRRYQGQRLVPDAGQIPAPPADAPIVAVSDMDVILLPLVAFGLAGERLGSGAGFYDRALANVSDHARPERIGLAFELQRCSALRGESWDVPLHAVISELAITSFSK